MVVRWHGNGGHGSAEGMCGTDCIVGVGSTMGVATVGMATRWACNTQ